MVLPDESPASSAKALIQRFQSQIQQDSAPLVPAPSSSFGSAAPRQSTPRTSWLPSQGGGIRAATAGTGTASSTPPARPTSTPTPPIVTRLATLDTTSSSNDAPSPSSQLSPSPRSPSIHAKEGIAAPPPLPVLLEPGKLTAPPIGDEESPPPSPALGTLGANGNEEGISPLELSPQTTATLDKGTSELEGEKGEVEVLEEMDKLSVDEVHEHHQPEEDVTRTPTSTIPIPPSPPVVPHSAPSSTAKPKSIPHLPVSTPSSASSSASASASRRKSLTDPTASFLAKVRAPTSSRTSSPSRPVAKNPRTTTPTKTATSSVLRDNKPTSTPPSTTARTTTPTSSRIRSSTPSKRPPSSLTQQQTPTSTSTSTSTPRARARTTSLSSSTVAGSITKKSVVPTTGTPRSRAAAAAAKKLEEEKEKEKVGGGKEKLGMGGGGAKKGTARAGTGAGAGAAAEVGKKERSGAPLVVKEKKGVEQNEMARDEGKGDLGTCKVQEEQAEQKEEEMSLDEVEQGVVVEEGDGGIEGGEVVIGEIPDMEEGEEKGDKLVAV